MYADTTNGQTATHTDTDSDAQTHWHMIIINQTQTQAKSHKHTYLTAINREPENIKIYMEQVNKLLIENNITLNDIKKLLSQLK